MEVSASLIGLAAQKKMKGEMLQTYLTGLELDSDVYRLSNVLYKKEFPIWKKVQKGGKLSLTKDSIRKIDVDVLVEDGGKQRKIPTLNRR